MAVTIVVANRKGGSGKTTTTVNLADGLARRGKRVLVVDADSQAQATVSIGVLPHRLDVTLYELLHLAAAGQVLHRDDIRQAIIKEGKPFHLIPSKPDLSAVEVELAGLPGRESLLKDLLLEIAGDYDFILIDLPPSLGLVAVNGLAAGDWLLIPMEPSFLSMDGLAQMMGILYRVNAELSPSLRLLGILPVKCDLRTNLARNVLAEIKANFGPEMLLPAVRNDIRLAEAPSFGKTIFEYAPGSRGAQDYESLVEIILSRSGER